MTDLTDRRLTMFKDNKVEAILTFALGVGVGTTAALLLAPKSGEELRGDIADGLRDGVDQVRDAGKDLGRKVKKIVPLVQDHVHDAIETGQDAYNIAKK
jgi:gas vesicle protein